MFMKGFHTFMVGFRRMNREKSKRTGCFSERKNREMDERSDIRIIRGTDEYKQIDNQALSDSLTDSLTRTHTHIHTHTHTRTHTRARTQREGERERERERER